MSCFVVPMTEALITTVASRVAKHIEKKSAAAKSAGFTDFREKTHIPFSRKDACNQVFYENLGQWASEFLESRPTAEDAAQAVQWILEYPARHQGSGTYWMTYAAQKHAQNLIPM